MQGQGIGLGGGKLDGGMNRDHSIDHVVRHFDVNRAFVGEAGIDTADNLGSGAFFIQ